MKKQSIAALLVLVPLLLTACGSSGSNTAATASTKTTTATPGPVAVTVTAGDSNGSISLKTGDTLIVELAGNPTTGYQWQQTGADTAILRQTGEPAFTPESSAVGAPGKVSLRFEAVGAGQTLLQLIYQRPFEPQTPPVQTFQVNVSVAASTDSGAATGPYNGGNSTNPSASGIPTDPPAIQGTITSVSRDSILVEENPQDSAGSNKILLRLTADTRILKSSGAPASPADLVQGLKVRVWVTGPVATSYPMQGQAAVVVID